MQQVRKENATSQDGETHEFPINLKVAKTKERSDISVLEGDKAKSLAATSFPVKHDRRINNFTKLREEITHRFRSYTSCEATDEELGGTLMLLARDSSLGIDLIKHDIN